MPFCPLRLGGAKPREIAACYPTSLDDVGDHIRKARLDRGITQRQAARQLGILPTTLCDWERHRTGPRVFHFPAVVRFLGYNPLATSRDLGSQVRAARWAVGLSRIQLARRLGLDAGTIVRVERGRRVWRRNRRVLEKFATTGRLPR